jgi:hypothetical protein
LLSDIGSAFEHRFKALFNEETNHFVLMYKYKEKMEET